MRLGIPGRRDFVSLPGTEEYMSSDAGKLAGNRKALKKAFVVYWRHYGR
jgi:hypothetical protein